MSLPTLTPQFSLSDLQSYVRQMEQERGFSSETVQDKCLILAEEVGELAKAIRKSHTSIRTDKTSESFDIEGEFSDILMVLGVLANRLNVNLAEAFLAKEEKNKKRNWH